jgi:hypothetical protein
MPAARTPIPIVVRRYWLPEKRRRHLRVAIDSRPYAQRFPTTHAAIYHAFEFQRHMIRRPTIRIFRFCELTSFAPSTRSRSGAGIRRPEQTGIFRGRAVGVDAKARPGFGFVYILSNDSMPGLYKIGFTHNSVRQRIRDLSATGVPTAFRAERVFEIPADSDVDRPANTK